MQPVKVRNLYTVAIFARNNQIKVMLPGEEESFEEFAEWYFRRAHGCWFHFVVADSKTEAYNYVKDKETTKHPKYLDAWYVGDDAKKFLDKFNKKRVADKYPIPGPKGDKVYFKSAKNQSMYYYENYPDNVYYRFRKYGITDRSACSFRLAFLDHIKKNATSRSSFLTRKVIHLGGSAFRLNSKGTTTIKKYISKNFSFSYTFIPKFQVQVTEKGVIYNEDGTITLLSYGLKHLMKFFLQDDSLIHPTYFPIEKDMLLRWNEIKDRLLSFLKNLTLNYDGSDIPRYSLRVVESTGSSIYTKYNPTERIVNTDYKEIIDNVFLKVSNYVAKYPTNIKGYYRLPSTFFKGKTPYVYKIHYLKGH